VQAAQLRLLCVARLVPEKGHQYLFEAVRVLVARGVAVSLNLAGDGPLRGALEDLANKLAISANVHFLGEQTGLQVRQLFCDCDIAVLASLSESMGLVNMEGMASGRPVIATAVLGVPELVEDRVTGFLCPPANPAAIADTIQWILSHPDDTRKIVERGKGRVKTEFSREACTRQLISAWH
jgi:glycosyltransferase involved in cell wall biosynthesis